MRLTLEPTDDQRAMPLDHRHPKITIEVEGDDWNLYDLMQTFIGPGLVAFGFSEDLVKEYTDPDERVYAVQRPPHREQVREDRQWLVEPGEVNNWDVGEF